MDGVSDRPWSGISKSSYPTADAYCAACVIDLNAPGTPEAKERCKLPVYEPASLGGRLNRNGVRAAAERLLRSPGGLEVPDDVRRTAANRLLALYRVIGEPPPRRLVDLARDPLQGQASAGPECRREKRPAKVASQPR